MRGDFGVCHAVQRDASRKAEVLCLDFSVRRFRQAQQGLLQDELRAGGKIGVLGPQLAVRLPRRAEGFQVAPAVHPHAARVVEVAAIESEGSVRLDLQQPAHLVGVAGAAVGGQPHDLVLVIVDPETQVGRHGAVEQPEGMREMDLLDKAERASLPSSDRRGSPLSDPVHGQDCSLFERGEEVGRSGMGEMMLPEDDPPVKSQIAPHELGKLLLLGEP